MEDVQAQEGNSDGRGRGISSGKKPANKHVPRVEFDTFARNPEAIIQTVDDGSTLTSEALLDPNNPLTIHRPIVVTDTPESIGMKVPRGAPVSSRKGEPQQQKRRKRITIRQIGQLVGMHEPVTVMDVRTQEELEGWMMSDLVEYFEDEERLFLGGQVERRAAPAAATVSSDGSANSSDNAVTSAAAAAAAEAKPSRDVPTRRAASARIQGTSGSGGRGGGISDSDSVPPVLNQISLEFSHTPLIRRTRSPSFVRDLDWVDNLWPAQNKKLGDYPVVQYYCLTSTAGCYTDFHEDFGGTSVWYSVLSGAKVFLLAPPTENNLKQYEAWLCRHDQQEIFYPDMEGVEDVVKVTLKQDQTMLIPAGWIHAVYTPVDSIVVGGNFLHGLAMETQLDIHCIETRTRVPSKFRFPHFVRMMFYAGAGYLERMRSGSVHEDEVKGMKVFAQALRSWAVSPGGDAERPLSDAGTAAECAERVGCIDAVVMVDKILDELDRIKRDGIVPLPGRSPTPKLKISLKNESPPPPSTSPPRPKLKLKLGGNLGASLKDDGENDGKDACADDLQAKSEAVNDAFRITVPASASTIPIVKKRKLPTAADLVSRNAKADPGDEEWTPGTKSVVSRRKPKLSLSPPRSPKGGTNPKQKKTVGIAKTAAIAKARSVPKAKKGMSARDRLKKKMKF